MNLRILAIDDEEQILANISQKLNDGLAENPWQSPVEVYPLHSDKFPTPYELMGQVDNLANERWDALLVDVNLYGPKPKDLSELMLPMKLVRAFRAKNQTAIALIFSGNIQDHLRDVFTAQASSESNGVKGQVERHVRSIIDLGIVSFSAKHRVVDDTIGHLLRPPWLLRLERELLRTPSLKVDSSTLARLGLQAGNEGATFAGLAELLRKPGTEGEVVARIAAEFGVAVLADLFA